MLLLIVERSKWYQRLTVLLPWWQEGWTAQCLAASDLVSGKLIHKHQGFMSKKKTGDTCNFIWIKEGRIPWAHTRGVFSQFRRAQSPFILNFGRMLPVGWGTRKAPPSQTAYHIPPLEPVIKFRNSGLCRALPVSGAKLSELCNKLAAWG